MIYEDSNNKNNRWDVHGLKAQKEPSPGQSETSWSGTLCKMYPDGPRPTGARGTFEMYFRMELPMFPAATLPFPSAGDVLPRCLSLRPATFGSGRRVCGWAGYPGCRSFHSLCPGLGSSCPFGAYMSNGVYFVRRVKSERIRLIRIPKAWSSGENEYGFY